MTEMGIKFMGRRIEKQESHGHDGMHSPVLRVLVDILMGLLMIIFEGLWRSGAVPENWKKENVTLVFKKCKEDPENYSLNFTGEVMESLIMNLSSVMKNSQDNKVIRSNQH